MLALFHIHALSNIHIHALSNIHIHALSNIHTILFNQWGLLCEVLHILIQSMCFILIKPCVYKVIVAYVHFPVYFTHYTYT